MRESRPTATVGHRAQHRRIGSGLPEAAQHRPADCSDLGVTIAPRRWDIDALGQAYFAAAEPQRNDAVGRCETEEVTQRRDHPIGAVQPHGSIIEGTPFRPWLGAH
jgi:hypothetical protein